MEQLVSVIVPVYNVEKYLRGCLDCIVNQTYKNLEIILVDDGTKDNSDKICDEYAGKDNRITVLHTENRGQSAARNTALDVAKGEYITFIDSDDIVSTELIEELMRSALEENAEISICDSVNVYDITKAPDYNTSSQEKTVSAPIEIIRDMWYQKSFMPSPWAKLFKAEIFDTLRFKEGVIFEDIDILHEVFIRASKIVYIHKSLYGYVHHENSTTIKAFSDKDLYILKVCEKIRNFAKEYGQGLEKAALAYSVTGNMRIYLAAPGEDKYMPVIKQTEDYIKENGRLVLKDRNIRRKSRLAIRLFYINKSLFRFVHSKINRWK